MATKKRMTTPLLMNCIKYILSGLCFLLYIQGTVAQKNDLVAEDLKGKVKKVIDYKYTQEPAEERWPIHRFSSTYNEKGYLTEFLSLDVRFNTVEKAILVQYDQHNRRITDSTFGPDRQFISKSVYRYNNKGQIVVCFKYGKNGTLLERKIFTPYTRNEKTKRKSGNGYKYKYDSKGNETSLTHSTADGKFDYQYTRTYDRQGNVQTETYQDHDTVKNYFLKNEYNQKGILQTSHKYSTTGVLLEETNYTYNYDYQLNWIRKQATTVYFTLKTPYYMDEVEEREVTYY